jgi:hypothetical protein
MYFRPQIIIAFIIAGSISTIQLSCKVKSTSPAFINTTTMKEINSLDDFYSFLDNSKAISDDFERSKLIIQQLSSLSNQSIVNYENYFRKELVRFAHYNLALLYELQYPSPLYTKNGKPLDPQPPPYLSTDGFIYFRCGMVLLGKEIADSIMKDPEAITTIFSTPPLIDAESMLYVSEDALKLKGADPGLLDSLDEKDHYDSGNFEMRGSPIKWYDPETVSPKLAKFYGYKRMTMDLTNFGK